MTSMAEGGVVLVPGGGARRLYTSLYLLASWFSNNGAVEALEKTLVSVDFFTGSLCWGKYSPTLFLECGRGMGGRGRDIRSTQV